MNLTFTVSSRSVSFVNLLTSLRSSENTESDGNFLWKIYDLIKSVCMRGSNEILVLIKQRNRINLMHAWKNNAPEMYCFKLTAVYTGCRQRKYVQVCYRQFPWSSLQIPYYIFRFHSIRKFFFLYSKKIPPTRVVTF